MKYVPQAKSFQGEQQLSIKELLNMEMGEKCVAITEDFFLL